MPGCPEDEGSSVVNVREDLVLRKHRQMLYRTKDELAEDLRDVIQASLVGLQRRHGAFAHCELCITRRNHSAQYASQQA